MAAVTYRGRPPLHQILSQENMRAFIDVLSEHGNFTLASHAVGCSPKTAHRWVRLSKAYPKHEKFLLLDETGELDPMPFHLAVLEARRDGLTPVEDAVIKQVTGVDKPVIFQGQVCYELDFDAEPKVVDGRLVYPPKRDPMTGDPIVLTVREIDGALGHKVLVSRHPDYKPRSEVDITTTGKPIVVPERSSSIEDFMKEFGVRYLNEEKKP